MGPRLFNSLPRHLRNLKDVSTDIFKNRLDKYLKQIPDEPTLDHYRTAAENNTIDAQLRYLRVNDRTISEVEATP